ncbi:hypothetical protein BDQ12DRAFT_667072 [Crucibulum laeve]|uniref:DUF6533 domain-containing protein n=1 Tax=Crucibulum laeve TaxID=68775 RepID=A0A5C3M8I0_9AGAR|nr:hypothetical protein BDQ12DRAFT_667072 [Crucibulum laeve]
MALKSSSLTIDSLIVLGTEALALKYSFAASFSLIIWDHILNFGEEIDAIWNNHAEPFMLKSMFIVSRYVPDIVFAYSTYGESQIFWRCGALISILSAPVTTGNTNNLNNTLSSMALDVLYSRNHIQRFLPIHDLSRCTMYTNASPIQSCILLEVLEFGKWIFALLLFFDTVVLALMVWNALAQPRQRDSELLFILRRDGIRMFWLCKLTNLPAGNKLAIYTILMGILYCGGFEITP